MAQGSTERDDLTWSSQPWRLPLWFWLSLAAMAVSIMHMLLDFGVGLFPMQDTLAPGVVVVVLLIPLIQVWWVLSLMAGARGARGGVASAVILGLGWTLLTNGSSIQFCPPRCPYAAPMSDVAHVGSVVLGIVAPLAGVMALLRMRTRVGWVLPVGALVLVVATIWSLATSVPD